LTNIVTILQQCGERSLVLLDEIGTGTDPAEGAALAAAILEHIYDRGAVTIASTHYPEIKTFALSTPGFRNGAMAFDRENLQPLYRLTIGQPGASQALWIAAKLGIPQTVLLQAQQRLGGTSSMSFTPEDDQAVKPEQLCDLPLQNEPPAQSEMTPIQDIAKAEPSEPAIKIGDMVSIPFLHEKGVVCTAPDAKDRIRVLIKGKKMEVSVKRVKLLIPAEQLYPEDYDLNIVLLSKEERRLKHQMERKLQPGLTRIVSPDEQ
jgi:dsDNA-specific endonuclease/ATPase MutS2